MKKLVIILFVVLASGCSTYNSILDNSNVPKNSGVVLIGLHTNWEGHEMWMIDSLKIWFSLADKNKFEKFEFRGNKYLHVRDLPEGEYSLRNLIVGQRQICFDQSNTFTIEKNKINYIGDVYAKMLSEAGFGIPLEGVKIHIKDSYGDAIEFLNKNYPLMIKRYEVINKKMDIALIKCPKR